MRLTTTQHLVAQFITSRRRRPAPSFADTHVQPGGRLIERALYRSALLDSTYPIRPPPLSVAKSYTFPFIRRRFVSGLVFFTNESEWEVGFEFTRQDFDDD